MRRLIFRALLVAALPFAVVATPDASAKPTIPGGCDLFRNTMCHCLGPGVTSCGPVID